MPAPVTQAFCSAVDLKTLQTAEKLARFVAQVGPEIEQFSIENSADNPDLWYVVPSATHSSRLLAWFICLLAGFS